MTFDPTVSLGVVLHLIGLLITVLTIFWKVATWIGAVRMQVTNDLHALHASNLAALARIDSRLSIMEVKVDDLWEARPR